MKPYKLLIVDGQGGGLGRQLVEAVLSSGLNVEITAVGANSAATAAMLKAGAHQAATGENAAMVCAGRADCIMGPLGIVIADSMLGEITSAMARAIGQSRGKKVLLPVSHCGAVVAGVPDYPLKTLVADAMRILKELMEAQEA